MNLPPKSLPTPDYIRSLIAATDSSCDGAQLPSPVIFHPYDRSGSNVGRKRKRLHSVAATSENSSEASEQPERTPGTPLIRVTGKPGSDTRAEGFCEADQGFIILNAESHDIDRSELRAARTQAFVDELEPVWRSQWKTRHSTPRYKNVSALLLFWEDEQLLVKQEVTELENVFSKTYGFKTEIWTIPSSQQSSQLATKVESFVDQNSDSGNLVIIYYGGHAFREGDSQPTWFSYSGEMATRVEVESSMVISSLKDIDADALLLWDSCQAVPESFDTRGKGAVSVIAATGFEPSVIGVAPVPGPHSFTRSLIDALCQLSSKDSFTDIGLHSLVTTRLKSFHSSPIRRYDGSFVRDEDGCHVMDIPRRRTPIYRFLARNQVERCLHISPLRRRLASQVSAADTTPTTDIQPSKVNYDLSVNIRLAEGLPETADFDSWAKWLLAMPVNAQDISVTTEISNKLANERQRKTKKKIRNTRQPMMELQNVSSRRDYLSANFKVRVVT
ncbi:hypothetical protein B0T17DRAFT_613530 [Bombardia bombarda]|uniref:Caspase domain-containing protein n=1 Tax=Bombardia bombarda TaxID=252184 RepID=A0AA40CFZ4_9PEZI|nr:hypothetical protein B0T17DRAFT_613530 [Bombardia bombarda]